MRLMVSDLKAFVFLFYPLVALSGMLQLNNIWNVSHAVMTSLPTPSNMQLFMGAMIYPLFLTAFFKADPAKPVFQISTIAFLSALLGLVAYPLLVMLLSLVITGFSPANPWLNGIVVLLDVAAATGFLLILTETDLHKIPSRIIWGSLLCLELTAAAFVMYQYEIPQQAYHFVVAKIASIGHQAPGNAGGGS